MKRLGQAAAVLFAFVSLGAGPAAQSPQLDRVMHDKLTHTQKILEAVVTSNWVVLERETRELERLTNEPAWTSLKLPEYASHSTAFIKALHDLHEAAAQRDLDETPKAYVDMTLKCVDCHRYLARARIAR